MGSQHVWELAKLRGAKAIMHVLDDSLVEDDIESIWKGSSNPDLEPQSCLLYLPLVDIIAANLIDQK
jgi:hypothetical protein